MSVPRTITPEESEKIIGYLKNSELRRRDWRACDRDHLMALLMLDAGLRVGELVQLSWPDLWIVTEPTKTLFVRPDIAKRKIERTIPLTKRVREAVHVHHANSCDIDDELSCMFAFRHWSRGQPLTTRQVERIIRAAALETIGRPITPHMLRHTFATRLMQCTNIRVVQELLGHKALSSTQVYTHPNESDKKQAIEALD